MHLGGKGGHDVPLPHRHAGLMAERLVGLLAYGLLQGLRLSAPLGAHFERGVEVHDVLFVIVGLHDHRQAVPVFDDLPAREAVAVVVKKSNVFDCLRF